MKILAFDSSSDILSIGLFEDRALIREMCSDGFTRHSSELVPMLERLFKESKLIPSDLGCIVVGLGPGSFTGLRVGVTTAKTMAYILKTKLVGVSSLEAMALRSDTHNASIPVCLDARRANVYGALYQKKSNGSLKTLIKPTLFLKETFFKKIGREVWTTATPLAQNILDAAWPKIQKKKWDNPFKLEPLYLYKRDCNATRPKK